VIWGSGSFIASLVIGDSGGGELGLSEGFTGSSPWLISLPPTWSKELSTSVSFGGSEVLVPVSARLAIPHRSTPPDQRSPKSHSPRWAAASSRRRVPSPAHPHPSHRAPSDAASDYGPHFAPSAGIASETLQTAPRPTHAVSADVHSSMGRKCLPMAPMHFV
jgi:hypothetical protein